jgi:hypothetical protein
MIELTPRAGLQPLARRPPRRQRAKEWNRRRMIETRGAGPSIARLVSFPLLSRDIPEEGLERSWKMAPQRTGERAPSTRWADTKVAAITARVIGLWQKRADARWSSRSPVVDWGQRLEALGARVEHLEAELEGLQDAVYRQALLEQAHIGELRRRTEPKQLARDLGEDARRRGL